MLGDQAKSTSPRSRIRVVYFAAEVGLVRKQVGGPEGMVALIDGSKGKGLSGEVNLVDA